MVLREDGKVTDARVLESCGNNAIDRSVVTAIYKASPLPLPLEPRVFDPNVTVQFTP
jgi:colicin import membrane protein